MDNKQCCDSKKSSCSTEKASCSTSKTDCGTKKCETGCWGKVLKGAIFGGIVFYIVSSISWAVLPFHAQSFNSFKDEAKVTKAIVDNAGADGMYVLPFVKMDTVIKAEAAADAAATDAKKPAKKETVKEGAAKTEPVKAEGKPAAFITYVKSTNPYDHKDSMIHYTLLGVVLAGILTCILKRISCGVCPVGTSFKIGLIAALASEAPLVIWYHFPMCPALLNAADTIVAFTLAGAVIAKFVLKMPMCNTGCNTNCKTSCK